MASNLAAYENRCQRAYTQLFRATLGRNRGSKNLDYLHGYYMAMKDTAQLFGVKVYERDGELFFVKIKKDSDK